jgi:hypothetical protein
MDYKTIFNGDLKDWYLITKQTNTPELIAMVPNLLFQPDTACSKEAAEFTTALNPAG